MVLQGNFVNVILYLLYRSDGLRSNLNNQGKYASGGGGNNSPPRISINCTSARYAIPNRIEMAPVIIAVVCPRASDGCVCCLEFAAWLDFGSLLSPAVEDSLPGSSPSLALTTNALLRRCIVDWNGFTPLRE